MATPKPFETQTNEKPKSVVDDKVNPTSLMEILVGGPYGGHIYGHTALRVKKPAKEYVYDFGRYRNTYSENIGMGIELKGADSPRGEGILNIWENFDDYIAGENGLGRTTWGYKYKIFDAQADAVINFYQSQIEGLAPIKKTASFKAYKLQTDYFALGPNCTTLSISGAKHAVPRIDEGSENFIEPSAVLSTMTILAMKAKYGTPTKLFLPVNLQKYLDTGPKIRVDEKATYGGRK
jgi:hypothetical protein